MGVQPVQVEQGQQGLGGFWSFGKVSFCSQAGLVVIDIELEARLLDVGELRAAGGP